MATDLKDLRFAIYINNNDALQKLTKMDSETRKLETSLKDLVKQGKVETSEYKEKNELLKKVIEEKARLTKESVKLEQQIIRLEESGKKETKGYADKKQKLEELRKKEAELTDQGSKLLKEQQELINSDKRFTQEYKNATAALEKNKLAQKELTTQAGLSALSIRQLTSLEKSLRAEWQKAIPGSEHRAKLEKELGIVKYRLDELKISAIKTGHTLSEMGKISDGGFFSKIFSNLKNYAGTFLSVFAVNKLGEIVSGTIRELSKISDSFADISKAANMSQEEVFKLNDELGKINTRTSMEELRKISVVAGQLGVDKEKVLGFTQSVDMLNVALGDEIKGGSDAVANTVGKLRNVLTDLKTKDIASDMLYLGNALNTLGANGFATSDVISDFSSRIGGMAIPLGMNSGQVLGLSATLQELNVTAERGGTAVGRILLKMTQNTGEFARIAGKDVKEFTTTVNTDLFGAFLQVIEGSKKSGQSATVLSKIINDLGVDGAGASEVFMKLGGNLDMLKGKVKLSSEALKETGSITDEFNKKNNNLAGSLAKLWKFATERLFNSSLFKWLSDVAKSAADAITPVTRAASAIEILNNASQNYVENLHKEQVKLDYMFESLKMTNKGSKERKDLINEINTTYGTTLQNLDDEKLFIDQLTKSYNALLTGMKKKAIMNARQSGLNEVETKRMQVKQEYETIRTEYDANVEKKWDPYNNAYIDVQTNASKNSGMDFTEFSNLQTKYVLARQKMEYSLTQLKAAEDKLLSFSFDEKLILQSNTTDTGGGTGKTAEELEKERKATEAYNTRITREKAQRDKETEALNKWLEDLEKLNEEYGSKGNSNKLTANQKEIKAAQDKYDKLIDQERKFIAEQELLLKDKNLSAANRKTITGNIATAQGNIAGGEEEKQNAVNQLQLRQQEDFNTKMIELEDRIKAIKLGNIETEEQRITAKYEKLKQAQEGSVNKEAEIARLEKARVDEIDAYKTNKAKELQAELDKIRSEIDMKNMSQDQIELARIDQKYALLKLKAGITADQITQINKDAVDERAAYEKQKSLETARQVGQTLIQSAQIIANAIFQIQAQNRQYEFDGKMQDISDRRDAELENEDLTSAERKAIMKKYHAEERVLKQKNWLENQKAAVTQAIINGALAVVNIMATSPIITWPFAIPLSVAATLAQIAVIKNQKMPQFAKGNFPVTGADDGITYNATFGGKAKTGIASEPTLYLAGEKGPEMIIDSPTLNNMKMNYPGIIQAIQNARVPQFATGYYTMPYGGEIQSTSNESLGDRLDRLETVIDKLNTHLDKGIKATSIIDRNNITDLRNEFTYRERIEREVS